MTDFIFATGIENSIPTIHHGAHRVDEYATCRHYENWKQDIDLTVEMGTTHLRYGCPLHTTFLGPNKFDWTFADETFSYIRSKGIIPIMDLCHFGVPDWLGNFQNADFPELFAGYAKAFASRYPWVQHYTPVNEMLICATFSARYGWWNEQLSDDRSFVTALKNIVRANVRAMQEIIKIRPDALFIQSESVEAAHPATASANDQALLKNEIRFLTFDLNYGRPVSRLTNEFLFDNGMTEEQYGFFMHSAIPANCIMGIDYYITSEHYIDESGLTWGSGDLLGMSELARQYYARYGLPMMHTETNMAQAHGDDEHEHTASNWLNKQWANILSLKRDNIPVLGFTWYSLCDQIDWDTALREANLNINALGLYDLDRKIRPVGETYKEIIKQWAPIL